MKVTKIDNQAGRLAENKNRVFSVDRVRKQDCPAQHAEIPERSGNNTFFLPLTFQPLDEKTAGKAELPDKTDSQPDCLAIDNVLPKQDQREVPF